MALKKTQMNYGGQPKYNILMTAVRSVFEWSGNKDLYKCIPTDQLSLLLTLITLHVTLTTTLLSLQSHTAKNSASIFSSISRTKQY